ncbi:zinc-binding alcohol dehydrogenase family protein [Paenibacillus sp. J5C_2022]|uniref:zinc-binding alcohol dehydrogenase family protein n=1 Tax=Paenibacillus sp. J5C2022 TaxID=2977129 RepID=UPI0021D0DF89|nr:zinc-binding alcohol dehydrogenase family protein [Paenibacillus sp. J5C2022]MCU6707770.1 zinc-binding alcohol dehydrogenase family protein [Paenibacillus sp. J5C2022]
MRGIVCEQVNGFRMAEDLPEPEWRDGEAIVAVKRIGICGTDLHAYKGNQPFFNYPRILGHELSGIIERIGGNDAGLREGDQVTIIPYLHCGECIACRNGKTNCCVSMRVLGVHTDGGMRERIAVPVTHLIRSEGLSLDQAALLEPLAIGAHAVRRSGLAADDTVLVVGAGPIGLGVMALAKYAGARVVAMDMNAERLAFCRSWAGVDHAINVKEQPGERLSELTGGDYPALVFDATGNAQSMMASFGWVAHGGALIYVGLVKGELTFNDPEFHKRELTLMGSRNATKEDFDHVLGAIRAGAVDMERYITHRSSFEDMIGAFDSWLKPESGVIKAIVEL